VNSQDILEELKQKFNKTLTIDQSSIRKPYLGISYPNLKIVAKEIFSNNYIDFLETNDFRVYELEILQTIVIGKINNIDQAMKYFKIFANQAKEWSVVDSLCQRFIITRKYEDEIYKQLIEYSSKDDEYLQRIVAVMLLSHFNNDKYIDKSLDLLTKLKNQGYYTKMAVAWALATMMVKYPDKCIIILENRLLDQWTHNKSIQKMIESFRVTQINKEIVNNLKY
jgi:3-methyladenine DNA glycosylase AlkD